MERTALPKWIEIAIRSVLIVQLGHTLLLLLIAAFALREGVHDPGLPWILSWIIALTIESALLLQLSSRRNWVWVCTFLLLIDASIWAVHGLIEFRLWLGQLLDVLLLVCVPVGFSVLYFSRRAFSIAKKDVVQIVSALFLSACIVSVDGRFFSTLTLDWLAPVHAWHATLYQIYEHPIPQEGSLVLCWGMYGVTSAFLGTVRKINSKAFNGSLHS